MTSRNNTFKKEGNSEQQNREQKSIQKNHVQQKRIELTKKWTQNE